MLEAYKRTLDFKGRAGRKEYWLFVLAYVIALVIAMVIDGIVFGAFSGSGAFPFGGPIYLVTVLAHIVTSFSVSFRRLHDINRSAWWLLIGLIPLIGGIVLLVFSVLPGTPGSNRFGPAPGTSDLETTFA